MARPLSFADALQSQSAAVANFAQAQEANAQAMGKNLANASSFMDLQQKIRMMPAIDNQIQQANIESQAALERSKARSRLLSPDIIAKQEAIKLDMETDDLARERYTKGLGAIAQWQQPITTSNKKQFLDHLAASGEDPSEYNFTEGMSPGDMGILAQSYRDLFISTQKQLQAKDLMDVEQQLTLDRDQELQYDQLERMQHQFIYDMALQQSRLEAQSSLSIGLGKGKLEWTQEELGLDNIKDFTDQFVKSSSIIYPKAEWTQDEASSNKVGAFVMRKAKDDFQKAYVNWETNKVSGNWTNPPLFADYREKAEKEFLMYTTDDGETFTELNSPTLKKRRDEWYEKWISNEDNKEVVRRLYQDAAESNKTITEEAIKKTVYGDPVYRGWTSEEAHRARRRGTGIPINPNMMREMSMGGFNPGQVPPRGY